MTIEVDLSRSNLTIADREFIVSCVVRNEINGWRRPDQVVRSIPDNKPVYPRQFPKGTWTIYGVEYTDEAEFAPVKIKTDAFKMLPIWELDEKGHYSKKTDTYTRDEAYWMHYSHNSGTTLGCIRLNNSHDALTIAKMIEKQLEKAPRIELVVL